MKRYNYGGIWKRYKFGQVCGKWWWKKCKMYGECQQVKEKRMCLKKIQKQFELTLCYKRKKKVVEYNRKKIYATKCMENVNK